MNILFIIPEYYPHSGGGISTYYLHYIKALQPYCHKIKVITGSGYTQSEDTYQLNGIVIEYLKPAIYQEYLTKFSKLDLLPEVRNNMAAAWAMFKQAEGGNGYDVIECTDFGLGFIPWVINHQKPLITRLHGSSGQISIHEKGLPDNLLSDFNKQAELLLLPLSDKLITYSKANQQFWEPLFKNKQVKHIDPVYSVETTPPMALAQRENHGLVTARIQQWKGPVQLCEAMAKITRDAIPPIRWIGRNVRYNNKESTSEYLKARFPSIWNKMVTPQNPVPNQEIIVMQRKAKFGLVPSTWDMFNFTCLEFLSAGTPVICSDGAGCADLVTHGKNGFKYAANDTSALAGCLQQMNAVSAEEYSQMALAGQQTIAKELSPDRLMPLNIEQYQSAINDFKPSPSNPFLDALYKPSDKLSDINDTLDTLPLKRLVNYVLKRIKSKTGINI